MDPFIEASGRWRGFHTSFLSHCRDQLIARLPTNYDADIEERVELVDQGDRSAQSYHPDVSIRLQSEFGFASEGNVALADLEPIELRTPRIEIESTGYIEIRNLPEGQLVTVIEVLSPTNKTEPDRLNYRTKMQHFRQEGVHVVELDLLLGGIRLAVVDPIPAGDYFAFVSRCEKFPLSDVYSWSIRRLLPKISVPLKRPDPDITLDLAAAFTATFDQGGYARRVRYDLPLPGNLSEADREWVKSIIAKPA